MQFQVEPAFLHAQAAEYCEGIADVAHALAEKLCELHSLRTLLPGIGTQFRDKILVPMHPAQIVENVDIEQIFRSGFDNPSIHSPPPLGRRPAPDEIARHHAALAKGGSPRHAGDR